MSTIASNAPSPLEEAKELIFREIYSNDVRVTGEYFRLFEHEVEEFSTSMANAVAAWQSLDHGTRAKERAFVVALANAAITLHIGSMKLFMSGQIVAAGNLSRQVVETIALTLLCSNQELRFLKQFMENKYSTSKAIDDVIRNARRLGLHADALQSLKKAQDFYHKYSHLTQLTLANQLSFSEEGTYIGACFDPAKIDAYKKEIAGRVGLAKVFPNFIEGVKANIAKWKDNAPEVTKP